MASNFITIDASKMESIDYAAYLADYFGAMGTETRGATTYYDSEYFAPFGYYDAGQVGIRYDGSENDAQVLMEGDHMQYDGIVGQHGSYSGSVDSVTFGYYNDSTTFAQIDNVARSTLIGMDKELVVSGLDISAAVGAGTGADNVYYQFMLALRDGNSTTIAEGNTLTNGELAIQMLYDAFAARGQYFIGSAGDDAYTGTKFKDKIDGGEGFDTLSGGKGKDVFIFELGDSTNTIEGADIILDFQHGKDRINLRGIDANINKDGDQAFKFIGNNDFTGKAGQLHFERSNGDTHISMDVDGDKVADMMITLDGKIKLTADDFFL
ncbi:MAG: M10 family metallopeptidase C-terminal domain-containing protein [Rhizobiaceae bacterium]|nr:M10 family metallopeptidase C-terminal domain-containing protein [Rhizobiaceae bacterium]